MGGGSSARPRPVRPQGGAHLEAPHQRRAWGKSMIFGLDPEAHCAHRGHTPRRRSGRFPEELLGPRGPEDTRHPASALWDCEVHSCLFLRRVSLSPGSGKELKPFLCVCVPRYGPRADEQNIPAGESSSLILEIQYRFCCFAIVAYIKWIKNTSDIPTGIFFFYLVDTF